ncbi:hypothetical protein DJ82_04485 [Halorubrum sp. Ib24]|uniref:hypothetical protein n=1 Tax=unclassified Halorubrum TaxID=2642239 RepID=UPI000B98D671|nr:MULTISPECIES: hypothetical protein [unclassified Halorubrum]OYR38750.1 hypothetical protein DJ81_17135 [Halorubrum sp. Hd13]OYR41671.1 hypothetical protein DJ82_04485 [Halorubrum sp. Ib24]OYR46263.1 hypothetical protein DJ75_06375 [Halorubrum sp. Eb13]
MQLPESFDRSLALRQSTVYVAAFCAVFAAVSYVAEGSIPLGVATGFVMAAVTIGYYAWNGELGVPPQRG